MKPKKGFKFDSMTLEIPLKPEFAKRIHSTCNTMRYNIAAALPEKQGELWNSMQGRLHVAVSNNFRPYIWVGDLGEGLAFFTESDKVADFGICMFSSLYTGFSTGLSGVPL